MAFSGSVYVSTSAQKYVMYRKPTNIVQAFWGFLYIMYFLCTLLTYTEPEKCHKLECFCSVSPYILCGREGNVWAW